MAGRLCARVGELGKATRRGGVGWVAACYYHWPAAWCRGLCAVESPLTSLCLGVPVPAGSPVYQVHDAEAPGYTRY